MPYEKQLISEFNGMQIKFIAYFDRQECKGMAKRNRNVGDTHFLILEGVKSALVQYLSFREILRYIRRDDL